MWVWVFALLVCAQAAPTAQVGEGESGQVLATDSHVGHEVAEVMDIAGKVFSSFIQNDHGDFDTHLGDVEHVAASVLDHLSTLSTQDVSTMADNLRTVLSSPHTVADVTHAINLLAAHPSALQNIIFRAISHDFEANTTGTGANVSDPLGWEWFLELADPASCDGAVRRLANAVSKGLEDDQLVQYYVPTGTRDQFGVNTKKEVGAPSAAKVALAGVPTKGAVSGSQAAQGGEKVGKMKMLLSKMSHSTSPVDVSGCENPNRFGTKCQFHKGEICSAKNSGGCNILERCTIVYRKFVDATNIIVKEELDSKCSQTALYPTFVFGMCQIVVGSVLEAVSLGTKRDKDIFAQLVRNIHKEKDEVEHPERLPKEPKGISFLSVFAFLLIVSGIVSCSLCCCIVDPCRCTSCCVAFEEQQVELATPTDLAMGGAHAIAAKAAVAAKAAGAAAATLL